MTMHVASRYRPRINKTPVAAAALAINHPGTAANPNVGVLVLHTMAAAVMDRVRVAEVAEIAERVARNI